MYLEQLLFLRDFVVDLPASRAGNGASGHLLERLGTAETSRVTAPRGHGQISRKMTRNVNVWSEYFVKDKLKASTVVAALDEANGG